MICIVVYDFIEYNYAHDITITLEKSKYCK